MSRLKPPFNNEKYFDEEAECIEHNVYKCEDCADRAQYPEITAVAVRQERGIEAENVKDNFISQAEFIQAALDLDDDKLDKIKVKDMGEMTEKAKNEITIGKMKKWLHVDGTRKSTGVIGGLFKWIRMSQYKKK